MSGALEAEPGPRSIIPRPIIRADCKAWIRGVIALALAGPNDRPTVIPSTLRIRQGRATFLQIPQGMVRSALHSLPQVTRSPSREA